MNRITDLTELPVGLFGSVCSEVHHENHASPLTAIAPGPLQIVRSSARFRWRGFLLEKHLWTPGHREDCTFDRHVISMLCGQSSRLEYRGERDWRGPYLETPGAITIMPAGRMPSVRLHTSAELIHCGLEEEFVRRVLAEMEQKPERNPVFRIGLRDTSIQRILNLLMEELEEEAPSGRLYVESLAHALATRYLQLQSCSRDRLDSQSCALPPRILNRVRERIAANLHADVSLDALAEESGYSRAHFLRMFRAATGITPHQYVMDARMNYAKEWLRRKSASLIDIAAYCGFASQSHMTSVFRKRLGMTPAEFRRGE